MSDLMLKCTCIPERKTNKSRFCARVGEEEDINKLTENSFCDFPALQGPDSSAEGKKVGKKGTGKGKRENGGEGRGRRDRERENLEKEDRRWKRKRLHILY